MNFKGVMFIYLFVNCIRSKLDYIQEHFVNKESYDLVLPVPSPESECLYV